MHTQPRHSDDVAGTAHGSRMTVRGNAGMFMWAVTFLLLALVSAIFAFGGTAGEPGGLYARMATVGFLVIALVMFFIRRTPPNPR